jgi:hypothetical protein
MDIIRKAALRGSYPFQAVFCGKRAGCAVTYHQSH